MRSHQQKTRFISIRILFDKFYSFIDWWTCAVVNSIRYSFAIKTSVYCDGVPCCYFILFFLDDFCIVVVIIINIKLSFRRLNKLLRIQMTHSLWWRIFWPIDAATILSIANATTKQFKWQNYSIKLCCIVQQSIPNETHVDVCSTKSHVRHWRCTWMVRFECGVNIQNDCKQ